MQITKTNSSPTNVKLTIVADQEQLDEAKAVVLKALRPNVKVPGFRSGKVPMELVEKNADPAVLQSQFIDEVINRLYSAALVQENLRPATQPQVSITKFVPFSLLEADVEVEVVGEITLPDYKKLRIARPEVKVEAKDVEEVLTQLRSRAAEKKEVTRASKEGDEVVIDFAGSNAKTKAPIDGGTGKDYALVIGSNSFIPGFEPELVGLKAGESKTFTISFPKDYGVKELQSLKAEFEITVHKVTELVLPKLDEDFVKTVGPFTAVSELKADIKKQLLAERTAQAERDYESVVLEQIAEKSKIVIPNVLIEEEINRHEADERQNLVYRGQTWKEHLAAEGVTAEEHREKQRQPAELRVKAGLVLAEIADREGVQITKPELDEQLQKYRKQYTEAGMLSELDKPETRREIASRLMSQKTIGLLTTFTSK